MVCGDVVRRPAVTANRDRLPLEQRHHVLGRPPMLKEAAEQAGPLRLAISPPQPPGDSTPRVLVDVAEGRLGDASCQGQGLAARKTNAASSTIWVGPRPSSSGGSNQIVATAMTGIVRPMLAIAEPSARLRLTCMRLRRAALAA